MTCRESQSQIRPLRLIGCTFRLRRNLGESSTRRQLLPVIVDDMTWVAVQRLSAHNISKAAGSDNWLGSRLEVRRADVHASVGLSAPHHAIWRCLNALCFFPPTPQPRCAASPLPRDAGTPAVLFLGTEKYPQEGEFEKFLAQHGGSSNAVSRKRLWCLMPDDGAESLRRPPPGHLTRGVVVPTLDSSGVSGGAPFGSCVVDLWPAYRHCR